MVVKVRETYELGWLAHSLASMVQVAAFTFPLAVAIAQPRSAVTALQDNVFLSRLARAELFAGTGAVVNPVDFAALRGKVVFLDVWAAWCEPCLTSMPKIEAIYRATLGQPALGFLSVHDGHWERRDITPHDFLAAHGCDFITYIDRHKNFTDSYDWIPFVNSLPKFILIGKDGRIAKRYSEEDVQEAQADMLRLAGLPAGSTPAR